MDWFIGAKAAQEEGITRATHQKYTRSWNLWLDFQRRCNTYNPYLDGLHSADKIQLIGAFMHAVRIGTFNPQGKQVSGATARKAVSHVAAEIVASGRSDPTKNSSGKTDIRIIRQKKNYQEQDPPTKHQKALPTEVYKYIYNTAKSPREKARATLLCGALFWGCRSCEYTKVPRKEQKTRPLRTRDFTFKSGNTTIPHNDPNIFSAQTIIASFGLQKSGAHYDEIPMDATSDPILNPIALIASTISRLRSYPGFNQNWPIYTFYDEETQTFSNITSKEIENDIKRAVSALGRDKLGFGPEDVGTHSNRSSLAMLLYLQHVPPYTIMLIGRWRSDAFLSYIEQQCKEFTKGMSQVMLNINSFNKTTSQHKTHQQHSSPKPQHHFSNLHNAHFVHFGRLNALRSNCRS